MSDAIFDACYALYGTYWRSKIAIRSTMFREQLDLHDDPAQFRECHSGRRAGKSDGAPKSACMDALDAGLNEVVLIGAETLKKARQLHWANVAATVRRFALPLVPNASDASWTNPAGGRIQFWGLNDSDAVEQIRGFELRSARFDEAATLAPMLRRLVVDVVEPALGNLGGTLTLYGTPSVTRAGPWFEICEGKEKHKWAHHHWDARANPHFRAGRGGAESWFAETLARNGWTWDSPTFQREYLGMFVDDATRRVVEYERAKHFLAQLPANYSAEWPHVAGADYGYNDAFATVVLAFDPDTARKYVVHAEKASHLTYDDAADVLRRVIERWRCSSVDCDPAGGGKPFYETVNRKYGAELGARVQSAHKVAGSLVESIRLQNTELRCGRLFVCAGAEPLAEEWQVLPWRDDYHTEVSESYPQDCFDAARYALMRMATWPARVRPPEESEAERLERQLREAAEQRAERDVSQMGVLAERF